VNNSKNQHYKEPPKVICWENCNNERIVDWKIPHVFVKTDLACKCHGIRSDLVVRNGSNSIKLFFHHWSLHEEHWKIVWWNNLLGDWFEFVLNIGLGCFVFCALCLFVFPKKVKKMQGLVDVGRCKIQDHIWFTLSKLQATTSIMKLWNI
jgi:hypothetical protein